jgi:hypothetical protein
MFRGKRTKALPDKSPPVQKWQCNFHGRAFVRTVICYFYGRGLLSALSFSWEGFCPPCHFHRRAFVCLVIFGRDGFCPTLLICVYWIMAVTLMLSFWMQNCISKISEGNGLKLQTLVLLDYLTVVHVYILRSMFHRIWFKSMFHSFIHFKVHVS